MANRRVKNSVGIWAFGPNATRFVPGGYHAEVASEDLVTRTTRVVNGLGEWLDGLEYHYPGEINEQNADRIRRALGKRVDLYAIPLGIFSNPRYALGSFINPDATKRQETLDACRRAIDLCAALGAHFLVWPGAEGYNYPFQRNWDHTWGWFLDGLAEVVQHCNRRKVRFLLEHKNSEPAMRILMRDIGTTIYCIKRIGEMGIDVANVGVNMDWQHLIMNGEPLAAHAALLAREGLLGHQHANDGWGTFDDDNMVGTNLFMQTLALARTLQDVNYGARGERLGFDLYPYTEDQVAAVKQSILNWEFIDGLARKLDRNALADAEAMADAVAAYREVYRVLGLTDAFIERRRRARQA